jgi:hypothetical protein
LLGSPGEASLFVQGLVLQSRRSEAEHKLQLYRFIVSLDTDWDTGREVYAVYDTTLAREVCRSFDKDDAKTIASMMSKHFPKTAAEATA